MYVSDILISAYSIGKRMTIRSVLSSAFDFLFEMESRMNQICDQLGDASEEEMDRLMEENLVLYRIFLPCMIFI